MSLSECPECGSDNVKMTQRAREHFYGNAQTFKCRDCTHRWSE